MKKFLTVSSFLEGTTGIALLSKPSIVISLLLGAPLVEPLGIMITRIAGAALFSIALVCWFLRKNNSALGLLTALLFYNIVSSLLLSYAGFYENLMGIVLWLAVVTHIGLAFWCVMLLLRTRNNVYHTRNKE
ncbi:hypothetical protein [Flavobacterium sp.]|uniref:hypothetical protein n=1 Tax=Flavobacterium sp. TaxID=239 RepID=UPI0025C36077|nr:hypothetical protein [Flavobacterium sp.]MBA4153799.1 hypothetical protein [Flavobacterium sp.]